MVHRARPEFWFDGWVAASTDGFGKPRMKSERAQSVLALLREFRVRGPYPSQAAAYRLEVVGLVVEKVKVLSSRVTPYNRTRLRFSSSDACSLHCF